MKLKILNMVKGYMTVILSVFCVSVNAQSDWPLSMGYGNTRIQIFKPETESFNTDRMSFRAAFMLTEGDNNVFGSLWADVNLQINKTSRMVTITKASVYDLRFPDGYSAEKESEMIKTIEKNLCNVSIRMDDILADLENSQNEQTMVKSMNNAPPVIYYTTTPSILVTIDGDPILQPTDTKDVEMVSNSPFLILKYKNLFYLSNGSLWYESGSPLSGWSPKSAVPNVVNQVAKLLKSDDGDVMEENSFYPEVIVSTVPAELIQTDGAPTFAAIPNTMMLYVSNTSDQIVMDIRGQLYFVLLSGRWYSSPKLDGTWKYVDFEDLPADFAKIPEGSNKDLLLASVPNTKASQDAVRESYVPQAAIVDRSSAKTEVVYDGDPYFENIEGTNMKYATNSSGTVIYENSSYYVVDNGVWFVGSSPRGPWIVSERRPVQVNIIPPSCPVYNVRYVYVYHSTPQVVYVGYTSGYLSSYHAGRVIVYGTGWRYRPWRGRCYYPRPCTWGFGMAYNPWHGWSVNFVYGSGWFGYSYPKRYYTYYPYYNYRPVYHYRSGWWGPPVYRPPYCVPYTHYYGNYQAQVRSSSRYNIRRNDVRVSTPSRSNNIYSYNSGRGGVQSTRSSVLRSSADSRQSLTRSYSAQARPAATSSRSSSSSTRPSDGGTRSSSTTSSRSSSGTTTTRQSGSSVTNATPSRSSSVTTRPSTSTGTRNPSSGASVTTPSRSSGSSTTTTPSRSSGSSTTTTPSRSSGSSTTTTPSRSSGSSTTTTPSRSSGSSTTTTPSRSSGSSTTTTPSRSSGSSTTTTPSRSSSTSTTTTPSRSSSSSTTTTPSRSSNSNDSKSGSSSSTSRSSSTTSSSRNR